MKDTHNQNNRQYRIICYYLSYQNLKVGVLGGLNILAMVLQVATVAYFFVQGTEMTMIIIFHAVTIIPSLLFHLTPELRKNSVYLWIAHGISSIVLGLLVITTIAFILQEEGWGKLGLIIVLILFVAPASITAVTLIIALNYSDTQPEKQVFMMYDPEQNGYVTMNPMMHSRQL